MWQSTKPSIEGDSDQPSEGLDSFGITDHQNDSKWQKHKQNSDAKKKKEPEQMLYLKRKRVAYMLDKVGGGGGIAT
jgi:hypothetical protein